MVTDSAMVTMESLQETTIMFGFRVGFSGSADQTALFTVRTNPRWRPPPCWKNFKWRISATGRLIHFMFCSRWGFRGRRI